MAVQSSTSASANNPINSNVDKAWTDNAKKILMNIKGYIKPILS